MSTKRCPITCHVLIASKGVPAPGVHVKLEHLDGEAGLWSLLAEGATDVDGRCSNLLPLGHVAQKGVYRITFETGKFFESIGEYSFYPCVQIIFDLAEPLQHYHIPLLISPFSYTTYRGS